MMWYGHVEAVTMGTGGVTLNGFNECYLALCYGMVWYGTVDVCDG